MIEFTGVVPSGMDSRKWDLILFNREKNVYGKLVIPNEIAKHILELLEKMKRL